MSLNVSQFPEATLPIAAIDYVVGYQFVGFGEMPKLARYTFSQVATYVIANTTPASFGQAMLAWFNTLPTNLPGTSGVLWNNGGTLAQS